MISEETVDTLEIADLEQDIGGMCAVESAEGGTNDLIVTWFIPPK